MSKRDIKSPKTKIVPENIKGFFFFFEKKANLGSQGQGNQYNNP